MRAGSTRLAAADKPHTRSARARREGAHLCGCVCVYVCISCAPPPRPHCHARPGDGHRSLAARERDRRDVRANEDVSGRDPSRCARHRQRPEMKMDAARARCTPHPSVGDATQDAEMQRSRAKSRKNCNEKKSIRTVRESRTPGQSAIQHHKRKGRRRNSAHGVGVQQKEDGN